MAGLVSVGSRLVASIVADNDVIKEIHKEYKKITFKLVSPPKSADLIDDAVSKRGKYYHLDQAIEAVIRKFGIQELIVNKLNEAKLRSGNAAKKKLPITAASTTKSSNIPIRYSKSEPTLINGKRKKKKTGVTSSNNSSRNSVSQPTKSDTNILDDVVKATKPLNNSEIDRLLSPPTKVNVKSPDRYSKAYEDIDIYDDKVLHSPHLDRVLKLADEVMTPPSSGKKSPNKAVSPKSASPKSPLNDLGNNPNADWSPANSWNDNDGESDSDIPKSPISPLIKLKQSTWSPPTTSPDLDINSTASGIDFTKRYRFSNSLRGSDSTELNISSVETSKWNSNRKISDNDDDVVTDELMDNKNRGIAYLTGDNSDDEDNEVPEEIDTYNSDFDELENSMDINKILKKNDVRVSSCNSKGHLFTFADTIVTDVYHIREPHSRDVVSELFFSHYESQKSGLEYTRECSRAREAGMTWLGWMEQRTDEDIAQEAQEENDEIYVCSDEEIEEIIEEELDED